jgi:hypothetical protein
MFGGDPTLEEVQVSDLGSTPQVLLLARVCNQSCGCYTFSCLCHIDWNTMFRSISPSNRCVCSVRVCQGPGRVIVFDPHPPPPRLKTRIFACAGSQGSGPVGQIRMLVRAVLRIRIRKDAYYFLGSGSGIRSRVSRSRIHKLL